MDLQFASTIEENQLIEMEKKYAVKLPIPPKFREDVVNCKQKNN